MASGNAGLVVAEYLIGVGVLARRARMPSAAAGRVVSLGIWLFSQDLGSLTSGQATDPNTGPLLALMAIALSGDRRVQPVERPGVLTSPATPNGRVGRGSGNRLGGTRVAT